MWVVFCILPFYFISSGSSSVPQVVTGISMILLFFICYVLSFISRGWQVYFWTSVQIVISLAMTVVFGYVYFSLFLAFFIGNIRSRGGFFTLYTILLVSSIATINYGFVTKNTLLITQFPFVLISLIAVILLPINTYNRNKREQLQVQLEDANKRISDLVKLEERQRIARDLHDTLGQKLSLIGLKSDLAGKLMRKNPEQAQEELNDVRQTARSALKEVREMVTSMRGMRVEDELFRVQQILKAAQIEFHLEGEPKQMDISLLNENVIGMCLKEAVTNIVKHSNATSCSLEIQTTRSDLVVTVKDNGVGMNKPNGYARGNGLRGMKERLEFVNGTLDIKSEGGTTIIMKVPNVVKQPLEEAKL
ncbi:MAG: histidine kinase [Paenibacillus sp.]|nr:histidine kinase [Paenibacillus sp.]